MRWRRHTNRCKCVYVKSSPISWYGVPLLPIYKIHEKSFLDTALGMFCLRLFFSLISHFAWIGVWCVRASIECVRLCCWNWVQVGNSLIFNRFGGNEMTISWNLGKPHIHTYTGRERDITNCEVVYFYLLGSFGACISFVLLYCGLQISSRAGFSINSLKCIPQKVMYDFFVLLLFHFNKNLYAGDLIFMCVLSQFCLWMFMVLLHWIWMRDRENR